MAGGHEVRTVEGLANGAELDPIQQGFIQCHGLQCGFCTPGMMMTTRALLNTNPDPTDAEIREAISGQICRCTGYATIVRSVRWAAMHEAAAATRVTETTESPEAGEIADAGQPAGSLA
jgi:carbon-monoxide dehydrogenase small subunit